MKGFWVHARHRAMVLMACLLWLAAGTATAQQLPDFTGIVKEYGDAVVNISTTQNVEEPSMRMPELPDEHPLGDLFQRFFGDEGHPFGGGEGEAPGFDMQSLGSGFIISADGYILTNNHVVKGADTVMVRLSDRRELDATVVGTDSRTDVALLKVEATDLPVVRMGKAAELEVGEWVVAIGSPFGFERSATAGIVSAKGRSLPQENYVPFIQTDVAINPGNSGSPLFNMDGEVVGVNSQIFTRTGGFMGLSFAIPIDVAMDVAQQLRDQGRVSRAWLGVLVQDVTRDLAESFGMDRPHGALVAQVLPDGPAAQSQLQVGDVIVEFNGKTVETSSDLPPLVGRAPVGESVPVTVVRDGKRRVVRVTLGELPEDMDQGMGADAGPAAPGTLLRQLGLRVSELDREARDALGIQEGGVLVEDVQAGPARKAGLQSGDVILRAADQAVDSVAALRRVFEDRKPGAVVPILVQRGEGSLFLALRMPDEKR